MINFATPVGPVISTVTPQPIRGVVDCSSRYLNELQTAAELRVLSCAEIWAGNVRVATFLINPSGSSLSVDRASPCRRSGSLVLTEGSAWGDDGTNVPVVPGTPQDAFLPLGSELVVYTGLVYGDGSQELIQVGVGPMEDVLIDDTQPNVVITLSWFDRMKSWSRAGFIANTPLASSTEIGVAIQQLLGTLNLPPQTLNFHSSGHLTPPTGQVCVPGDDPAQVGIAMANAIGYDLYYDPAGRLCFLPLPDQNKTVSSFTYADGVHNTLIEANRNISRANAPNYVIRAGDGTGSTFSTFNSGIVSTPQPVQSKPPHGIDVNPNSRTYYRGSYKRQVDYSGSSLITTQAQADAMADADLLKALGKIDGITLTVVGPPDMDVDDVVTVTRKSSKLFAVPFVVDSFAMTFGTTGSMMVVARAVVSPVAR